MERQLGIVAWFLFLSTLVFSGGAYWIGVLPATPTAMINVIVFSIMSWGTGVAWIVVLILQLAKSKKQSEKEIEIKNKELRREMGNEN